MAKCSYKNFIKIDAMVLKTVMISPTSLRFLHTVQRMYNSLLLLFGLTQ
jgi:hypothetical protein